MSQLVQIRGNYIIKNIKLNQLALDSLRYGEVLEVDIHVRDGRKLSDQQRRFFFALCGEYEKYTGDYSTGAENKAKERYREETGKNVSLSNCSVTEANRLIEILITWLIEEEIPVEYKIFLQESEGYKFTYRQIYKMCFSRLCCVCGKKHADICHVDGSTVGMGRNRRKISHVGLEVYPACREHHSEQHQIGWQAFKELYHIDPVTVDEKLDRFIKGLKI